LSEGDPAADWTRPLGQLLERAAAIVAGCRDCGHRARLPLEPLARRQPESSPGALAARLRCRLCNGSRVYCALEMRPGKG
jgi:hypothetical protein